MEICIQAKHAMGKARLRRMARKAAKMNGKLQKTAKNFITKYKEQILYLAFGVATTLVNWIVYTTSLIMFNLTISNIIAWFLAVIFAFFTNRKYVFKQTDASQKSIIRELSLFFSARVFSGIFEMLGLPLLVYIGLDQEIYGIEGAVAKIIISVIVVVSNYLFSKFIIFKK